MSYASITELPQEALGSNGRPSVALLASAFAAPAPSIEAPNGSRIVQDFPLFRAGKFKDSKGDQHEWTTSDLHELVKNFKTLRDNGILPNVPVRENHSRSVKDVGGYIVDARVEGDRILATVELTEPEVAARYDRGTYRSRSAEVGAYETNDGEVIFPTILGVAFCDIPAVEGLFAAANSAYSESEREVQLFAVTETTADGEAPAEEDTEFRPVLSALHALATKNAGNADLHSALMQIITAVEAIRTADAQAVSTGDATSNNAGAQMPDTFKFTHGERELELVGDAQTQAVVAQFASDLAAARTEITELQAEARTRTEESQVAAVDTWLHAKKIAPAQVDGLKAYVKTLNDEQFAAHSALVMSGPDLAIAADHSAGDSGEGPDAEKDRLIAQHRNTYSMLKLTGAFSAEQLADSKPARALKALGVTMEG